MILWCSIYAFNAFSTLVSSKFFIYRDTLSYNSLSHDDTVLSSHLSEGDETEKKYALHLHSLKILIIIYYGTQVHYQFGGVQAFY